MIPIYNYLRALIDSHASISSGRRTGYHQIADYGREFLLGGHLRPEGIRKMRDRECYRNATLVALEHPQFIYCEGLASIPCIGLPVEHAWVVTEEGVVIDPTWKDLGLSYFGIPFDLDYISRAAAESGYYGVINTHTWNQFPEESPEQFLWKGEFK